MKTIGISGIVNFGDWDNPDYKETGGINSVVKTIIPYLKADKIILFGITEDKKNLFIEKQITKSVSVFPLVFVPANSPLPKRVVTFLFGWRILKYCSRYGITIIYNHAEEFGFWLSFSQLRYIHHLHTFVNVMEVSDKKMARLKIFHMLWDRIRNRVIRHAHKIVAVNADITQKCSQVVGLDRIIEFPNYVDNTVFYHDAGNDTNTGYRLENENVALFIGRISYVKGLELFVDTVNELHKRAGNWIGLIVGNGDHELSLRRYIAEKNIVAKLIFTGPINDPAKLRQLYSRANIFLITSFSESVPLTLLESLSCGTPVVSTDVGIANKVLNQENGCVVNERDAERFADNVLQAIRFKSEKSLIKNNFKYSVEYASNLLNKEFKSALANVTDK